MLANPGEVVGWTIAVCVIGMLVCALGLNKGVERVTKYMMSALFVILVILIIRAVTLPGAEDGLAFYLMPDFSKMFANGAAGFGDAVYAAMGQSFFTLSIGIGSMRSSVATWARSAASLGRRFPSACSIPSSRSWPASSSFPSALPSVSIRVVVRASCS